MKFQTVFSKVLSLSLFVWDFQHFIDFGQCGKKRKKTFLCPKNLKNSRDFGDKWKQRTRHQGDQNSELFTCAAFGPLILNLGWSEKIFSKFINSDRFFDIFLKDFEGFFWQIFWRIFLTDFLTDFFERFIDRFFSQIFCQIFWQIFCQIFCQIFWQIFLDRFFYRFFVRFLTDFYNRFFDNFESN